MRLAEYGDAVLMFIAAVYFLYQDAYYAGVDSSLHRKATPVDFYGVGEYDIGTIRVQIFECHPHAMRDWGVADWQGLSDPNSNEQRGRVHDDETGDDTGARVGSSRRPLPP